MSNTVKAELKIVLVFLAGLLMSTGNVSPDHADAFQKDSVTLIGDIITAITMLYTLEHSFAQLIGDFKGGNSMLARIRERFGSMLFRKQTTTTTLQTSTTTEPVAEAVNQ